MRLPVLLTGLVLLGALLGLRIADPAPVSALRLAYFDGLQRISPREPALLPVRIVDIDEASLRAVGQWPWPRDRLAEMTRRLAEAGAAAIAFDVLFAEPDRLSPARLAERPEVAAFLRDGIAADRLETLDTDRLFAAAIAAAPVVLGTARSGATSGETARPKAEIVLAGTGMAEALPDLGPVAPLVPVLERAARGLGAISVGPGANGAIARTVPLLWTTPEGPIPSLALEALRVSLDEPGLVVWEAEGAPGTVGSVTAGPFSIPTTPDGQLWLRARPEDAGSYIPAHQVLEGGALPDLEGAIVFVGTSAAGLLDLRTTALGETVPGVAVHAQAVEQILTGQHLVRTDFAGGLELLLFVSSGLIVAAAMSLSGPLPALLVGGATAFVTAAASWAAFATSGLLIDATFPLLGGFLMFSLLTAYRLFVTDRDARRIRRSFSHYVAPDVLREIESTRHALVLGGKDQPVTVMFSDIRNFTSLGESLDAQALVSLLNRLFGGLSDEIMRHRGTIDKFMGDSVMAFWNAPVPAPDHALRACRAALDMRQALARFNAAPGAPEVRMGVGLETGHACVGNIGSRDRFNYTAIGETVNTAARLEAASRHVEFDIVAGSATADEAPDLAWLPAGSLLAKGVSERLEASILVGDEAVAKRADFAELATLHAEIVATLCRGGAAMDALDRALLLAEDFPGLAHFYRRLPARGEDFSAETGDARRETA